MVTNDATILRLKHDVLYEVAKAAWEGNLEEKRALVYGQKEPYCFYFPSHIPSPFKPV